MKILHKPRTKCPHCDKLLIDPMGNQESPILLVGDSPGYQETRQGLPFAFKEKPNQILSGDILRSELMRVGLSLNDTLITNLWQHQQDWKMITIPPKTARGKPKEKKVEACPMENHLNNLVRMFDGRTHILLMGSHVTEALLGVKYGAVSGTKVKMKEYPKIHFWVSPDPSTLFSQPIGELRLAFDRFAEDAKKKTKIR